jgi:serine/threonine-protein kinase
MTVRLHHPIQARADPFAWQGPPHVTLHHSAATGADGSFPGTLLPTGSGSAVELLNEVGRGGIGVVYKARQTGLDRLVAVKLLRAEHAHDALHRSRFAAEGRALARLSHRNIVQVYHLGSCAAGPFFVMEFIHGPSLDQYLAQGPVPIDWAARLAQRLARAAHHAHCRGVVHRDLKPANVLLQLGADRVVAAGQGPPRVRPKLIDFGLAKFLSEASTLTQPGAILGTPGYLAPEQADTEPGSVGPASDVYALGAILYALLTGRAPYQAGTALRTILQVVGPEMPPPVRALRSRVPARLERICMRCLGKQPAERYPTALALAVELRRFCAGG